MTATVKEKALTADEAIAEIKQIKKRVEYLEMILMDYGVYVDKAKTYEKMNEGDAYWAQWYLSTKHNVNYKYQTIQHYTSPQAGQRITCQRRNNRKIFTRNDLDNDVKHNFAKLKDR